MMNTVVNAKHMDITDAMRDHIESKTAKLPKYHDGIHSVEVILGREADLPTTEIVVQANRKATFVASERSEDMYACFDQCFHKIIEQLRRYKDKMRNHKGLSHADLSETQEH